jgi:small subunit ribosomal protein S18
MPESIDEKNEGTAPETSELTQTGSEHADQPVQKEQTAPRPAGRPAERSDHRNGYRDRPERKGRRGGYGDSSGEGKEKEPQSDHPGRVSRFKRKICNFCQDKNIPLDYKRPDILERFVTDRGKILPRRVTGTCARHQRIIAREIKRARIISLLPFVEQ